MAIVTITNGDGTITWLDTADIILIQKQPDLEKYTFYLDLNITVDLAGETARKLAEIWADERDQGEEERIKWVNS